MMRHSDAFGALTVTLRVHTQLMHCRVIEFHSFFTLVETIMYRVRGYFRAMFTITCTNSLLVVYERLRSVIVFNFNDCFECRFQGLAVLSPPSLQVESVSSGTQSGGHEFRTCLAKRSTFCVIIVYHSEVIDPHYGSQALNSGSLLIFYEVSYEKAFSL